VLVGEELGEGLGDVVRLGEGDGVGVAAETIVEMKKENAKTTPLAPLHRNTCRGCVWIRSPMEASSCNVDIRRDS
jgi:hypothetical protein